MIKKWKKPIKNPTEVRVFIMILSIIMAFPIEKEKENKERKMNKTNNPPIFFFITQIKSDISSEVIIYQRDRT